MNIKRMPDGSFGVDLEILDIFRDIKIPYVPVIDVAGGGGGDGYPGLCFTANTAGSTIGMTKISGESMVVPNLETSTDGQNWIPFVAGSDTITLANAGDKVYFRGNNPSGVSNPTGGYVYSFAMTGSIAASGDITTIINPNGNLDTLPMYAFAYLFYNCTSLTSAPELRSTNLGGGCYMTMFFNCTSLTSAPELPATTLPDGCYQAMFANCTSLNMIKIAYTGELGNMISYGWVSNVAPTGDFYYNGIEFNRNSSCVPEGWTVHTF